MITKGGIRQVNKLKRFYGNRILMLVLIGVVIFMLFSANSWAVSSEYPLTDHNINNAVEYILLTDSMLFNSQIDASTKAGIVNLTGIVHNLIAKERAEKLTQTLRGVRGVVNRIMLQITPVSDLQLREDVKIALLYDMATDLYELTVNVKDGIVTISGTVQSYHERQLTLDVIKSVKGVIDVHDNITVKTLDNRSDAEIEAEVKRMIDSNAWLASNYITTRVKDGIVTLTGVVNSDAQRNRAILLGWSAGVKSVNVDGIKVEGWARQERQRPEIATNSDLQIKQAVHDFFVYDPRVFSANARVDVEYGVVTLTGVVDNLSAKRAAEQDANNIIGVVHVRNLLKVRPSKIPSDETIAQNVKSAFVRNPIVESYEIDVKVKYGVVTLTGVVDSSYEKEQAEEIASRATGVVIVINIITVNSPTSDNYLSDTTLYGDTADNRYYYKRPYTSDEQIKSDIIYNLFWSSFVNSKIDVKVENGLAILSGTAVSLLEFNEATYNAFKGGARQVYNKLKIK